MKIIGKIMVDKVPESCSNCEFCDAFGSKWLCNLNSKEIKIIYKYSKRPFWCKLIRRATGEKYDNFSKNNQNKNLPENGRRNFCEKSRSF